MRYNKNKYFEKFLVKGEAMTINITAGDELNKILSSKLDGLFIPFNEAMESGPRVGLLFSDEFIKERCKHHGVTEEVYRTKLQGFLSFINNMDKYDKVILWFGEDDFCLKNASVVLEVLRNYKGSIIYNTVDEYTGEILKSEVVR